MPREEQGYDHRMAWLGKDPERSSSSKPPDMDQVTHPGKAVTATGQQSDCPSQRGLWSQAELLGIGMGHRDGAEQVKNCGLETQGVGTEAHIHSNPC